MRTRLVRPEFWADEKMADLPEGMRLFYIGLWALADDAGYFDWHDRAIAAELFRYEAPDTREPRVTGYLEGLLGAARIRRLPCQIHGLVPTLPEYRIKGGEQLFTIKKRHDRRCGLAASPDPSPVGDQAWSALGAAYGSRRRAHG